MSKATPSSKIKKFEKARLDPRVDLWRQLLVMVETLYEELEKKLIAKYCTYPRFRLLFVLYFEAPCSPASLAKRLHVSRSNLTTFLRRLEDDGLIYACPLASTDTRLKYVLSERGIAYTEELMTYHFENVKKLSMFSRPELIVEVRQFLEDNKKEGVV
jgi:DNA-binding MarR family transcriptional regulator